MPDDIIDRTKYVTISKLTEMAKQKGIQRTEGAIRRWLKDYPQFFHLTRLDGWIQVEFEKALPILEKIYNTISIGKNRGKHEVMDVLSAEFVQHENVKELDIIQVVSSGTVEGENKMLVDLTPEAWQRLEKLVGYKKGGGKNENGSER